jgi:hypothetical protein
MYVVSLKQCPDCGSEIGIGSECNKTTRICFKCSKVFQQTVLPKIVMNVVRFSIPPSNIQSNIITDISNLDIPKESLLSMEETHNIFYTRLTKSESLYVIKKIKKQLKIDIMKIPNKTKKLRQRPPTWEWNYQSINLDPNIGNKEPTPIIY